MSEKSVLIPDEWGKSSDEMLMMIQSLWLSLNPRFVGQVFRPNVNWWDYQPAKS